ncbi:fimbrillin family protein [Bacteroides acidifaciens]|uniref:fimbrillin family protein n=1 Tax=Bacteroides acidifaciens TaxID=85831 RepID=UPI002149C5F9|nr:fimbrillin family protein [Bacteroides acidifaciens]MCR2005413.1 fimbrillin family protein [Bacteroides acidifaciens]
MKQKLFLAAMAAIAMTSCSNDETLEINTGTERAIDFRTAMATRAIETTISNLDSFYVTAFNENIINAPYFKDLKFKKREENSTIFVSEDKYYYPGDGTNLTFYAYAPSAEELGSGSNLEIDNTIKNLTLKGFSPADSIPDQVDFIATKTTGNNKNNVDSVPLVFKHCLSQIEIKAIQQNPNNSYSFEIKGVRIAQAISKGDFDFTAFASESESGWNLSAYTDKQIYTYEFDEPKDMAQGASLMDKCGGAMLIPQQLTAWDVVNDKDNRSKGAYISLLLKITTKDGALVYPFKKDAEAGKTHAWAAIPVNATWEAGKKYVYRLNFASGAGYVDPEEKNYQGEPILDGEVKFDVEVTDWESHEFTGDMENGDIPNVEAPDENDNEDPWGGE